MDIYEQVMNSRVKGTEGNLLKLVQEELKERGGMTPRGLMPTTGNSGDLIYLNTP